MRRMTQSEAKAFGDSLWRGVEEELETLRASDENKSISSDETRSQAKQSSPLKKPKRGSTSETSSSEETNGPVMG